MKIKIENTKELFDELTSVAHRVNSLGAIVQNDMTISHSDFTEWDEEFRNTLQALKEWRGKIVVYMSENKIDDEQKEQKN